MGLQDDMHKMHVLYDEMTLHFFAFCVYKKNQRSGEAAEARTTGYEIRRCVLLLPTHFDRLATLLLPVVDQSK